MAKREKRIAVFPGTFDPATHGHLDVIRRGRKLFDELIVAVGHNPQKKALFTREERAQMLRELVADMPDVRVATFGGLTVDFAREVAAAAILRGIRNSRDLQFEFQVALTNRALAGVETVFIITSTDCAFISSSLIKQISAMGGDVSAMVPPLVVQRLQAKHACRSPNDHPPAQTE